jgi:transcriptional regulator with XRE-family HTH domain
MIIDIKTSELAAFLGKSKGFASQIKHGKSLVPINDCFRVSKRFGIPLHVLRPKTFPANKSAPTSLENNHGTD